MVMAKPRTITAARLMERMDEIGVSQDQLAAAIGCKQSTISRILTGESQNSRWLPKIAHNLAVNLNWLMGVTAQKIDMVDVEGEQISEDTLAAMRAGVIANRLQRPEQLAPGGGLEDKRQGFGAFPAESNDNGKSALRGGGGNPSFSMMADLGEIDLPAIDGLTSAIPMTGRKWPFPLEWVRVYSPAPVEKLGIATGIGDAMEPTLRGSDVLLIDCTAKVPTGNDQIWLIAHNQTGAVKRVRLGKGDEVRLLSDNPLVPDDVAEGREVQFLGRVVGFSRKM